MRCSPFTFGSRAAKGLLEPAGVEPANAKGTQSTKTLQAMAACDIMRRIRVDP